MFHRGDMQIGIALAALVLYTYFGQPFDNWAAFLRERWRGMKGNGGSE